MRVLALDPGDRVGWARADINTETGEWTEFRHGITPLKDMALAIHEAIALDPYELDRPSDGHPYPEYDLVIQEDWRLYPHMAKSMIGSSFPSVQFVGMVRQSCWINGVPLVTQGAGIKKTADKTLKVNRPDLYEIVTRPLRHDDAHDQDAIRHLYYWYWKTTVAKK